MNQVILLLLLCTSLQAESRPYIKSERHIIGMPELKTFEIFGTIKGEYKEKIYLFFEANIAQKDSIYSSIKDGKFYFHLQANLPVLCRIHFGENTAIQEFYVDSRNTTIHLTSKLSGKDVPDSLGGARSEFSLDYIKGSKTEHIKRFFESWKAALDVSDQSEAEKHTAHFQRLKELALKHPKNKATAYVIAGRIYILGSAFMLMGDFPFSYSELIELTGILDSSLHDTIEWENLSKILARLDSERNRTIGNTFPQVILKDTNDADFNTKNLRQKYFLIDFWASWCKPCRAMNPELKVLHHDYKQKGFEIIGISLDTDKEAWKKAILADSLTWIQVIDEQNFNGTLPKHYAIDGIPFKILIDGEGKVIGFDLSTAEVRKILKGVL